MENRPVKTVGLIIGAGMGCYHQQDMADLRQSFCGPETENLITQGDGVNNPSMRDVSDLFAEVIRPDAGRTLIVILADARRPALEARAQQPLQSGPISQAESWVFELNRLLRRQMQRPAPVDVFVLAAQQFKGARHARYLPKGSAFVAVKSPAQQTKSNWIKLLAQHKDADHPWPVAPGAKELLLDYLLSDGPLARARSHKSFHMPQIAVSDHYSHATLTDVWRTLTVYAPGDEDVIAQSVARLDILQQVRGYRGDLINQAAECMLGGKKPSCPADYAGALLARRAELFGLDSDWSWIDRLKGHASGQRVDLELPLGSAAPAVQVLQPSGTGLPWATGEQTDYQAVAGRVARRLTASEVAALPRNLRPYAHIPAVRKLVR